jgi:hypothetical protein
VAAYDNRASDAHAGNEAIRASPNLQHRRLIRIVSTTNIPPSMVSSFAGIGAARGMKVEDVFGVLRRSDLQTSGQ